MNIRATLTKQRLAMTALVFFLAFAGYHRLTFDECSPANTGPFDGEILYSCTVKAVANYHKNNVDPQLRQAWLKEWGHRYDHNMLKTETGTLKAVTEMLMSLNERFDYFFTPERTAGNNLVEQGAIGGIGAPIGLTGKAEGSGLELPKYTPAQVTTLLHDRLGSESPKITSDRQLIVAADPDEGSPAFNAGLRNGDRFIEVDGRSLEGMEADKAIELIRGRPGSQLSLKIETARDHKQRTLHLVRQIIELPVTTEKDIGDLGYVAIQHFESRKTASDVHEAVDKACGRTGTDESETQCKAAGLIIDLRYNPGGLVDNVLAVSQLFLDQGDLITEFDRDGDRMSRQDISLAANEMDLNLDGQVTKVNRWFKPHFPAERPIVVLVNERSASGAEMLAEILRGNNRAIIVGKRTVGKGVGQCVIPLPYQYSMDAICMEYLAAGKTVDWVGVTPDIEVDQPADTKEDLQLAKAIEVAHNPALASGASVKEDLASIMKQRKDEFKQSQKAIRGLLHL